MKIKPLFNNSVFGTNIFRALAARYGYRVAIKEVNRAMRHYDKTNLYIESTNRVDKHADLFIWNNTVQGLNFWCDLQYGQYNVEAVTYRNSRELRMLRVRR